MRQPHSIFCCKGEIDGSENMAEDLRPTLNPGEVIKQVYRIQKKLGEGGFGAVYLVEHTRTKEKEAMKVEGAKEPNQVLRMEVVILNELLRRGGRHVCKIIDRGRNEDFNYVIMTLVGNSLQELRKACPGAKLSIGSALRAGLQCMEALEDLHGIGYIHRDVKPGNFACGREEVNQQRTLYILDFGLSRRWSQPDGEIRTPRSSVGFRGTVRYAPLNCHNSRELSRRDDLETWFYMLIEITKGRLPWSTLTDKDKVGRYKVTS
ncbi:MAG: protein kinase, partial [Gammaproteobacteria bacterium]|nr:protein kinase [Gammaproteobacteria bacterium]